MSGTVLLLNVLAFTYLGFVIFAFTPYTNNLDEIKVSALFFCGPIFLVLYLIFAATGHVKLFPVTPLIPLIFFAIIMVLSTLIAGKPYEWIAWIEQMMNIALLGGFFIFFGLMRNKRDVHRAFLIYTIFGLGTTIFGLFHYSGGFSLLHKLFFLGKEGGETPMSVLFKTFIQSQAENDMFGTILNRQFYAAFLVMLIPLSTAFAIIEDKSHALRFAAIVSTILMGICLYLANSKASLGAIVVIAIVFFILYKRYAHFKEIRIPHLRIWIAGILLILLTLGFFNLNVGPVKLKTFHRAVASRVIIWKGAWKIFLHGPGGDKWYETDNPPLNWRSIIIGSGPACFRILFPRYRDPDYNLHDISHVTLSSHNRFLDLLAENGILGFICYVGFLAIFFGTGIKRLLRVKDGELRVYLIALLCGVFGIYLTNIFSPNSRWAADGMNIWVMLGLGFGLFEVASEDIKRSDAAGESSKGRKTTIPHIPPPPHLSNVLMVLAILILPIVFVSARYGIYYFIAAKLHNDGLLYANVGEGYADKAQKLTEQAQSEGNNSEDTSRKIKAYEQVSDEVFRIAIDNYKKSLEYNPYFITTYYKLAHAYNSVGDMESALEAYHDLQVFAPEYSQIHFNLGVINSALSQRKKRLAMRENGSSQPGENTQRAMLLREAEKLDEVALEEFKIAAKMSNMNNEQDMYGKKLIQEGKYVDALKVYQFLNSRSLQNFEYLQALAYLSEKLNHYEDALKYYTRLFQTDPTNENYSSRIEMLYHALNRPEDYEKFLLEFVSVNPLDPQPRMKLVELYERKKETEKLKKQLAILTRLPELATRLAHQPYQQQSQLFSLATISRNLKEQKTEKYFLQKCLQVDEASSFGKSCVRWLKEMAE
jgi:tetratricopeptide (TPR) repeat protein